MNPIILPIYTPLWTCIRDGSFGCSILARPLLVDNQANNNDLDIEGEDGDILDEYWNHSLPLLVQNGDGYPMIISNHSIDLRNDEENAIRSLIIPSPCDIIRTGRKDYQQDNSLYEVRRVGKGDPIIIVPDILKYEFDDSILSHVLEDILSIEDKVCGAYAIIIDPYNFNTDVDIIYNTSKGPITLYIKEIQLESHILFHLTTDIGDYPVYLYTDSFEYILSKTREELLQQISMYIRMHFIDIPTYFSDIDILQ